MKKLFTLLLLVIIGFQPVIGQSKKELKAEKTQKEYESIKTLVNSKQFEFDGDWATSSRGRRINLMSNPTYIKIDNNSADAYLPFFGTGYGGSAYGGDGAIKFKDPLENYEVSLNDKKQKITIKFNSKGENDTYNVIITVFPSGSTSVNISSSNRSNMAYSGKISTLKKKEKK